MGWGSAVKATTPKAPPKHDPKAVTNSAHPRYKVDWSKLVVIDFESYYSTEYTLRKLSTSEYVRDPRFKAHMVGIKIGNKAIKVVPTSKIKETLQAIDWTTHSLLCHNAQFDSFIMSHHYDIKPHFIFCTLSMARGIHSNDIGAGLDEVAQYYDVGNKLPNILESSKGIEVLPPALYKQMAAYCAEDVRLTLEIFKLMLEQYPYREIELIDLTVKMFTDPVLKVDIPLVEKELVREIAHKERLLLGTLGTEKQIEKMMKAAVASTGELTELKKKDIINPEPRQILLHRAKKIIGSNEGFAQMLRDVGIEPPLKISPAYFKSRDESKKYAFAFAKTDLAFTSLMEHPSAKIRDLVETRLSVKSTTNVTRAQRFLNAGANGWSLPMYLKYAAAHTWRWGGGDRMNMQNLKREDPDDPENTGQLRKSILAPKGHQVVVVDSGQIECVAHDTLVLTNACGYVKIQDILITDLLWDGVEWVRHDGVIQTGYKEVIVYDGLMATGNHKVWCPSGTTCSLAEASASQNRSDLAAGSLRGEATGFLDSTERPDTNGWTSEADVSLYALRADLSSFTTGCNVGEIDAVQKLRRQALEEFSGAWKAVRLDQCKVQYPDASELQNLRRAWDQAAVFLTEGIYPLDGGQSSAQRLHGRGDRSHQEQRSLQAGELEVIDAPREWEQPSQHSMGNVAREEVSALVFHGVESRLRLLCGHGDETGSPGPDRGADYRPVQNDLPKTKVYDILNAGPRHRFTAAGRIVSNCRVNGWLWDQDDLIESFRVSDEYEAQQAKLPKEKRKPAAGPNRDAYCKFGDKIYGREIAKKDKLERFVAKVATLGLGFQMGHNKFQNTLALGNMGPPVFFEESLCKQIVNTYRRENFKIVAGWKMCSDIILPAMARGIEGSHKCISWGKDCVYLPNGVKLKYPKLRCERNEDTNWDEWTYERKGERVKIYGGLLDENIVQALARIIVAEQMLDIAHMGWRVVTMTHDEVVCIAKNARAKKCYDDMMRTMRTPPKWCADIPLNCEGGYAVNYSK